MIEVIIAPQERQEEVWRLFLEYADELAEFDGEKRPHRKRHYPYFDLYWEDEKRTPFLVLHDHEPAGFCFLRDTGVFYRVDEFYIRPLHRRRGLGLTVVAHVREHCRSLGRHDTLAANVYVNNLPAVAFWKAAGFSDTGRRIRIGRLRLIEAETSLSDGPWNTPRR